MARLKFHGPWRHRIRGFATLNRIAITTYLRHALGRRLTPDWSADIEIGVRFWRHQFTKAMQADSIAQGRLLFDGVTTETDDIYAVETEPVQTQRGTWYVPRHRTCAATILYLHGGGYTFHGKVSERFAAMLAHRLEARLFAPDYRLTPEHPHPAQIEDALAAWNYVTQDAPPEKVVVIGDSAGGHLALMLLLALEQQEMRQPALCAGLCPWTDIGERGASLHANDTFDLVQGWMALQFGEWLDPDGTFGREALSPISHNFSGLAPLYMMAGGREILHDMIAEFVDVQQANGAQIRFDSWADMPHNFLAYDSLTASSREAMRNLQKAVQQAVPS